MNKVETKEKHAENILTKVEIERENLKSMHKLIDIEEDKRKYE